MARLYADIKMISEYIYISIQIHLARHSHTVSFLSFPLVLLELKEGVHPSRVRPVQETEPCDPDQASLLESTPTPTSVEVREN